MATKAQQKILDQIQAKGQLTTTSDRTASAAHALADQGVQHVYSCQSESGKTTHRFIKRQSCR